MSVFALASPFLSAVLFGRCSCHRASAGHPSCLLSVPRSSSLQTCCSAIMRLVAWKRLSVSAYAILLLQHDMSVRSTLCYRLVHRSSASTYTASLGLALPRQAHHLLALFRSLCWSDFGSFPTQFMHAAPHSYSTACTHGSNLSQGLLNFLGSAYVICQCLLLLMSVRRRVIILASRPLALSIFSCTICTSCIVAV